jgi:transcriptional regulator with XRE-family HTH domain
MQRFGEKVRKLRLRRRMTLKDLALTLGLSAHGYISEIESGKKRPTVDFVLSVARFFDVTTDVLLKDELDLDEQVSQYAGEIVNDASSLC